VHVKYLSIEEILRLHFEVINDFGGSHGVRDDGRLESVLQAPAQSVFGQDQYPSIFEKAAVIIRNIIADHPFVDGNKRTAVTCMAIFLMRNGHMLVMLPKELEDFAVQVAVEHFDIATIADLFEANSSRKKDLLH
jgi:death-on-curing protein